MKIGVLVVAYNAEETLAGVLGRIPAGMQLQMAEVLVQDDYSDDGTFDVATGFALRNAHTPITVLRHERNLGYGGNQKAGYTYAIRNGWDVVVLLHGDGQYAPEVMGDLVAPILAGEADAVFGSRMLERGHARAGGMPLYKLAGNRVLTTVQNTLTGLHLSEWHSGYRAYRVSTLEQLPFIGNSDGFDFDTEIILQLHAAAARMAEVSIPTYYGDEICYVNGLQYAWDVVLDTVRYRIGRSGFGTGSLGRVQEPYAFKPSQYSSHGRVLELMHRQSARRVLDVGCGPGWLAGALADRGHTVTGVDAVRHSGVEARMHRFVQVDLADGLSDIVDGEYDVVVAADVFEHVSSPERLMSDLASRLAPDGTVIASVPNIGHWYPRGRIALGLFDYDQRGILDATHLRFFTRRSFVRLVRRAGLGPVRQWHTGLPLDALGLKDRTLLARVVGAVDRALVRLWPTLFAYQFVYELAPQMPETDRHE